MAVPANGQSFANVSWQSKQWDDVSTLVGSLSYNRINQPVILPYRVIGLAINVTSADAPLNQAGTLRGGQMETHIASSTATTGGFTLGVCDTDAKRNYTYDEMMDTISAEDNPTFSATEGITVRALLPSNEHREFRAFATLPNYATGGYGYDCPRAAWLGGNKDSYCTGRSFVPTAVISGAAVGSRWVVKSRVIIEVDNSLRNLAFLTSSSSPYSTRAAELMWMVSSTEVFPSVVSGHSFWPSLVASAKGLYRLLAPTVFSALAASAASPAGPVASAAAGALANRAGTELVRKTAPKRAMKKIRIGKKVR